MHHADRLARFIHPLVFRGLNCEAETGGGCGSRGRVVIHQWSAVWSLTPAVIVSKCKTLNSSLLPSHWRYTSQCIHMRIIRSRWCVVATPTGRSRRRQKKKWMISWKNNLCAINTIKCNDVTEHVIHWIKKVELVLPFSFRNPCFWISFRQLKTFSCCLHLLWHRWLNRKFYKPILSSISIPVNLTVLEVAGWTKL